MIDENIKNALKAVKYPGYSRDIVVATDSNAMPGRAPRPNDASLDNRKAQRVLQTLMQPLMDALALVLQSKKEQEQERRGECVYTNVGKMMPARVHAVNLDVRHMREPGNRMPVACIY